MPLQPLPVPGGPSNQLTWEISRALVPQAQQGESQLALDIVHNHLFQVTGLVLTVLISIIGIRMLAYWWSFFLHSGRYRRRVPVTTAQLKALNKKIPYIKVQWTTKGTLGSTEVILRALRQVEELAAEDPAFYREFLFPEVVTENTEQAELIRVKFRGSPMNEPWCVVTPKDFETDNRTYLKAKQMQYLVELRRRGWQRKNGQAFIVHFDEDTLMRPDEFRKLIRELTYTDKKILTGPIYYPLEYGDATRLSRTTEASRPITCFECRRVMETGLPLHIHGSNLVVEEELENRVGWDIGLCDGQPYVAEDYVFGMDAFLKEGPGVFGWHGCIALEQPPFSFKTVFNQRYRWIFGVLQGMSVDLKLPAFKLLPWRTRAKIKWGTRYRILTFGLGTLVGALSLAYIPFALIAGLSEMKAGQDTGIPPELTAWFALIGFMWLGANIIGAWLNVIHAGLGRVKRLTEIAWAVTVSPVAGMMENMSGLKAIYKWVLGRWIPSYRQFTWNPTPSTKTADDVVNGRSSSVTRPLAETVVEAPAPWRFTDRGRVLALLVPGLAALAIIGMYVGMPLVITGQHIVGPHPILEPSLVAAGVIAAVMTIMGLIITRTARPARVKGRHVADAPAPAPVPAHRLAELADAPTQILIAVPAREPVSNGAGTSNGAGNGDSQFSESDVWELMRELTSAGANGGRS
jgi:Glycosyl transferase family group 2